MLIEQSIAKQYGVLPSEQGNLKYADWAKMVSGLMEDTPLGRVVEIRSERDPDRLRTFTPEQKQLRAQWRKRLAQQVTPEEQKNQIRQIEKMVASMFGGGEDSAGTGK